MGWWGGSWAVAASLRHEGDTNLGAQEGAQGGVKVRCGAVRCGEVRRGEAR